MRLLRCNMYLLLACFAAIAQKQPDLDRYKTSKEKLQAWADYCDEILYIEDYPKLRKVARKGFLMTPASDHYNQSLFAFYQAATFDYGKENDSAVYYLESSEKSARLAKNQRRIREALLELLAAYNSYGQVAKRERVLKELTREANHSKDRKVLTKITANISDYYSSIGQYEKALKFQIENIRIRKLHIQNGNGNDSINLGVALVNMSELYLKLKQAPKSLEYLDQSIRLIGDYKLGVAHVYRDYVETYLLDGNITKAVEFQNKLANYLNNVNDSNCWMELLESDVAFADYHLSKQQWKNANTYLIQARTLAPKYADDFLKGKIDHKTGQMLLGEKKYAEALVFLKRAEPILKQDSPENYSKLQKSLSKAYAATKNWQQASFHYELYGQLQDKLTDEKIKKNLAEMEARFQNNQKQQEINSLFAENRIKNLEIENAERQKIYFIIGLGLLLVLVGSLVFIYRNKQKTARILKAKNDQMQLLNDKLEIANQTKARLFSIIGHDLRSPVSHIYQFLDLQKTDPGLFSEADKIRHNERITDAAGTLLETMEDLLVWSKTQMQQFSVNLSPFDLLPLVINIESLMKTQFESKQIRMENRIASDLRLVSDKNILNIILRNVLQNAINSSPTKSRILLSAAQEEKHTIISITDSGSGMPRNAKQILEGKSDEINSGKSGLGLSLVRELADLIDLEIQISENDPTGTTIALFVKKNVLQNARQL